MTHLWTPAQEAAWQRLALAVERAEAAMHQADVAATRASTAWDRALDKACKTRKPKDVQAVDALWEERQTTNEAFDAASARYRRLLDRQIHLAEPRYFALYVANKAVEVSV